MASSKRIQLTVGVIITGLLFLAGCGVNNFTGGTESGNARVTGMLYQRDGKTPAAGVRVVIRPRKSLADTAGSGLIKRLAAEDSVETDNAGRFAFDSTLDNGIYVIEAVSGKDAALIDFVVVKEGDPTLTLPPYTLKPAGAIKGIVKLSEGDDPRKVFVLVYGIDRLARVEADGSFKIESLAEADYDLRILSSLDNYDVLDIMDIPVISEDTTDLAALSLPFTGIPLAKNISLDYDTSMQIVTLTWNAADTALVSGYHVYRRNVDSNTIFARLNTTPYFDTVFLDSIAMQDFTYEYKVTTIDRQGNEGKLGNGMTAKIVAAYVPVKVIESEGSVNDFVLVGDKLYICGFYGNKIEIVDTSGNKLGSYGDTGAYPLEDTRGIEYNNNIIYVVDDYSDSILPIRRSMIKCYDLSGNFVKRILYDKGQILDFVVEGDKIFTINYTSFEYPSRLKLPPRIYQIDSNGFALDSIDITSGHQISLYDSTLLLTGPGGKAVWLDLNLDSIGPYEMEWATRRFSITILAIDSKNTVYGLSGQWIYVLDSTGTFPARFIAGAGILQPVIQPSPDGLPYITEGRTIKVYKKR